MGLGDDIMWRAEAYHEWKKTGKRQRPYKEKKKRYTPIERRDIWIESPWISNKGDAFEENTNNGRRWYFKGTPYKPKIAPFTFKEKQIEFQKQIKFKDYIVINPYVKQGVFYPMKMWPYWIELINRLKDYNIVICAPQRPHLDGPTGQQILQANPNVQIVNTPNFLNCIVVISKAKLLITTEGANHHAAGNMQIPAIVIYGSHNSPLCTGYDSQVSITRTTECNTDGYGCHRNNKSKTHNSNPCITCIQAMSTITTQEVIEKVTEIINTNRTE